MTLAPGTRVTLWSIRPQYLQGVRGTIVSKQPDEPRYLVDIDNNPQARRYAGGVWCIHEANIARNESEPFSTLDRRAAEAAATWVERIAPAIDVASVEWANEHPELDRETYFRLHHPVLLWRFYYHLSNLLTGAARGWETVYYSAKEQDSEREVEGG